MTALTTNATTTTTINTATAHVGDFWVMTADDIKELAKYRSVQGSLTIEGTNLTTLDGLENLTSVSGELLIGKNDALTSLSGLKNLTSVWWVDIYRNPCLLYTSPSPRDKRQSRMPSSA